MTYSQDSKNKAQNLRFRASVVAEFIAVNQQINSKTEADNLHDKAAKALDLTKEQVRVKAARKTKKK